MRKFHAGIFFSCEQAADMNGKVTMSPSASGWDVNTAKQEVFMEEAQNSGNSP